MRDHRGTELYGKATVKGKVIENLFRKVVYLSYINDYLRVSSLIHLFIKCNLMSTDHFLGLFYIGEP